jgi:hypothetical protein
MGRRGSKLTLSAQPSLEGMWHAYVIRGYANIPWNIYSMCENKIMHMLKQYLASVFDYKTEQSKVMRILDIIRNKSRAEIKSEVRTYFPSLFVKKRPAYPLRVPDEFPEVQFDQEAANKLATAYLDFKKPTGESEDMKKNTLEGGGNLTGVMIEVERLVPTGQKTSTGKDRKQREKMYIDASRLTLENFADLTGRRFRMSNGQISRLGTGLDARQMAFNEFLNEAVSIARNQN